MSLDAKTQAAVELTRELCARAKAPVVYSSFGKDSMVLLEIVKLAGRKLPIVFHREPFMPHKYDYANHMILLEGYAVYDYPPQWTVVVQGASGEVEVGGMYRAGERVVYLPTGIRAPKEGEPWLCGLEDLYLKPTCSDYKFPWDLCFIGHKSTDVDPILGAVPLREKLVIYDDAPTYAFPIADFTDADVWEFHRVHGIPQHDSRYREGHELEDKTWNPDYFPACTACIDRRQPARVHCPRVGAEVDNVSAKVRYREPAEVRPGYLQDGR